jgi:CubicO group peptidase (beta-lactamase class C family)
MRTKILLTIIVFFFCSCSSDNQNIFFQELDLVINRTMQENKLPGLAIAIVKGDSVIFAKGYGVRKLGESTPVDEHTLFQAASVTKSFTATLLGIFVDRGKIKWTDPVLNHIPGFETSEPFVTQTMTIQDLVSLRSGLLGAETLDGASRIDLIPQIKNLKISNSFRVVQTSYNLNFTLAGLIAEIIEGKSWETLLTNELIVPLEMKETYTDIPSALAATKNISTPYFIDEEKNIIPTEWEETGIYGPADAVISNVIDLSNYVKLYLNNGVFENKSIINSETLVQIQTPQMITSGIFKDYFNPKANFMTFGSGCAISDYKGLRIIQMAGMISGSTSLITLIPSEKTGIVIQTNMADAINTFTPINYKIIDNLLSNNQHIID